MIDHKAKAKAVCRIIQYVTGLDAGKILIGYPNAGAPEGSYCTVVVTMDDPFGQAIKTQDIVDGVQFDDIRDYTRTQKVLQFSINFYRDRASEYIGAIKEANKRYPIQQLLRAEKLGWSRVGPVQNLTALFSANSEERYQCNLYLYCEDAVSDIVQAIYDVEYGLSVDSNLDLAEGSVNGLSS